MAKTLNIQLNLEENGETKFEVWRKSIDGNNTENEKSNMQILDEVIGEIKKALNLTNSGLDKYKADVTESLENVNTNINSVKQNYTSKIDFNNKVEEIDSSISTVQGNVSGLGDRVTIVETQKASKTEVEQAITNSNKYTDDQIKGVLEGEDLKEVYDTIKEIQDIIKGDDEETASIISSIAQNKQDIAGLKTDVENKANKTDLDKKADNSALNQLNNRVNAKFEKLEIEINTDVTIIDIEVTEQSTLINFAGSAFEGLYKDWGDGNGIVPTDSNAYDVGAYKIKIYGATSLANGFYAYDTLKNITKSIIIGDLITDIPANTFDGYLFNEVIIGKGVISIGQSAFSNCNNLKKVEIPDNVSGTLLSCFTNCGKLETVIIGSGITSLDSTFQNCVKLKNVVFNEFSQLKYLISCFNGCNSNILQNIIIPSTIFALINQPLEPFTTVEFKKKTAPAITGENPFGEKIQKIIVPNGSVDKYKNSWSNKIGEDIKKIISAVDTSDIEEIENKIDEVEKDLDGKANESDFNNLKDKVDLLEEEIDKKADDSDLEKKADKTELDKKADKSELDNYADKEYVDNQVSNAVGSGQIFIEVKDIKFEDSEYYDYFGTGTITDEDRQKIIDNFANTILYSSDGFFGYPSQIQGGNYLYTGKGIVDSISDILVSVSPHSNEVTFAIIGEKEGIYTIELQNIQNSADDAFDYIATISDSDFEKIKKDYINTRLYYNNNGISITLSPTATEQDDDEHAFFYSVQMVVDVISALIYEENGERFVFIVSESLISQEDFKQQNIINENTFASKDYVDEKIEQIETVKGDKGDKGDTGRGIASIMQSGGNFIVIYTDGTRQEIVMEQDYQFNWQVEENGLKVEGILPPGFELEITEDFDGMELTGIAVGGFYGQGGLTKVTIDVPHISQEAFYDCETLNDVTLTNKVTGIGENAFGGSTPAGTNGSPIKVTYPHIQYNVTINRFAFGYNSDGSPRKGYFIDQTGDIGEWDGEQINWNY